MVKKMQILDFLLGEKRKRAGLEEIKLPSMAEGANGSTYCFNSIDLSIKTGGSNADTSAFNAASKLSSISPQHPDSSFCLLLLACGRARNTYPLPASANVTPGSDVMYLAG